MKNLSKLTHILEIWVAILTTGILIYASFKPVSFWTDFWKSFDNDNKVITLILSFLSLTLWYSLFSQFKKWEKELKWPLITISMFPIGMWVFLFLPGDTRFYLAYLGFVFLSIISGWALYIIIIKNKRKYPLFTKKTFWWYVSSSIVTAFLLIVSSSQALFLSTFKGIYHNLTDIGIGGWVMLGILTIGVLVAWWGILFAITLNMKYVTPIVQKPFMPYLSYAQMGVIYASAPFGLFNVFSYVHGISIAILLGFNLFYFFMVKKMKKQSWSSRTIILVNLSFLTAVILIAFGDIYISSLLKGTGILSIYMLYAMAPAFFICAYSLFHLYTYANPITMSIFNIIKSLSLLALVAMAILLKTSAIFVSGTIDQLGIGNSDIWLRVCFAYVGISLASIGWLALTSSISGWGITSRIFRLRAGVQHA